MSVTIRPAREGDLDDIGRIYAEAVLNTTATFDVEPWTDGKLTEWFAAHGGRYPALVAEVEDPAGSAGPAGSDGRVVGWAAISPFHPRPGWAPTVENALYVAPEARERGVGGALLERLIDAAREAGHRVIVARVVEGNAASLCLHVKFGFVEVGTLKGVGLKFGQRLDVTILQKTLAPEAGEAVPGRA
ncbi:MAG: GNAT family N-acetyltransferase [Planctomycetota bacterium]